MKKIIEDSEVEQVVSFLEAQTEFTSLLGKDWVKNNLLGKKERLGAHYLFWLLLNQNEGKFLVNCLRNIKGSIPTTKFTGLINKLKRSKRKIEFYSLLSEIEVLGYYASKNLEIEYEPIQGDIKLTINNSQVFIEIAKLFSSKKQDEYEKLQNIVWEKLNNLDNPRKYIFSFSIPQIFSKDDVEAFVKFVDGMSKEKFTQFPTEHFVLKGTEAKVQILGISPRSRGYVGSFMSQVMEISSAKRLKAKILDELKQLPRNKLNVIVYNISDPYTHFDSIEDAFYGQSVARIKLVDGRPISSEPARLPNGVIHSEEGKQIGAIIAFYHFRYHNRKKYENPIAENKLPESVFAVL